jgi:hypothetical protein
MTTIHQIFTIRSFRSAKDRDFLKAIQIYDAHTHPQIKTDSREIAHWIQHGATRSDGKFYVCGLYVSGTLIGFVEFIYLIKERLIHFDYFVIESTRRTFGAFYTFAEEMRTFFEEEKMEWDFITAEVAHLDEVNGVSRYAQRLTRLFHQVGFCEVVAEYRQPLLGVEHPDTVVNATLLILPRVKMGTISRTRLLELVSAIYRKHYAEWYSIYKDTKEQYRNQTDRLFTDLEKRLANKIEIQLRGPEHEFTESVLPKSPPLREALYYLIKIVASAVAVAAFNFFLRHNVEFPTVWIIAISASAFVLLVVTISLTDKKRFEAFKLLVSLLSKFFDR